MPGIVHTRAHKALIATIAAYLRENGISQGEFARRCKRDEKWVSAVMTGHRGVQAGDLPKIARACKAVPMQFFKRWLAILST